MERDKAVEELDEARREGFKKHQDNIDRIREEIDRTNGLGLLVNQAQQDLDWMCRCVDALWKICASGQSAEQVLKRRDEARDVLLEVSGKVDRADLDYLSQDAAQLASDMGTRARRRVQEIAEEVARTWPEDSP